MQGKTLRQFHHRSFLQDKKDFYEFTLALDALKSSLNGSEKTLILGPDSPLAQILLNR